MLAVIHIKLFWEEGGWTAAHTLEFQTHIPTLQEKFLFHYSPWKSVFAFNEPALNILYLKKKKIRNLNTEEEVIWESSGEGLSKDSTFELRLEEKFLQLVCGRNSWVWGNSTAKIQENEKTIEKYLRFHRGWLWCF